MSSATSLDWTLWGLLLGHVWTPKGTGGFIARGVTGVAEGIVNNKRGITHTIMLIGGFMWFMDVYIFTYTHYISIHRYMYTHCNTGGERASERKILHFERN